MSDNKVKPKKYLVCFESEIRLFVEADNLKEAGEFADNNFSLFVEGDHKNSIEIFHVCDDRKIRHIEVKSNEK